MIVCIIFSLSHARVVAENPIADIGGDEPGGFSARSLLIFQAEFRSG